MKQLQFRLVYIKYVRKAKAIYGYFLLSNAYNRETFLCRLCPFCDSRCVILRLSLRDRTKTITSDIKEIAKMKMLNEVELEMIAGGHIPIISPGEGTTIEDKEPDSSDRSGGATYTW